MNRDVLEIFLPAFILTFAGIVALGNMRRCRNLTVLAAHPPGKTVRFIAIAFRGLLVGVLVIAFIYLYAPQLYRYTIPFDFLDQRVINAIGVLILKVSLVWVIVAQYHLYTEKVIKQETGNSSLHFSECILLSGMVIMFFGFFVTLSSVGTILISLTAFILFEKLFHIHT